MASGRSLRSLPAVPRPNTCTWRAVRRVGPAGCGWHARKRGVEHLLDERILPWRTAAGGVLRKGPVHECGSFCSLAGCLLGRAGSGLGPGEAQDDQPGFHGDRRPLGRGRANELEEGSPRLPEGPGAGAILSLPSCQSPRKAMTGSTLRARLAGTQQETKAVPARTAATPA